MKIELKREFNIYRNKEPVKSLSEYIDVVSQISSLFNDMWFRGQSKRKYKTLPSIYRDDTWLSGLYTFKAEDQIFKNFKRKCRIEKKTDYEYLHLMQHYGLPTRLLDWTECSLTALFFAIHDIDKCDEPEVWIINPFRFNEYFHNENVIFLFYGDDIHPKIKEYLEPMDLTYDNIPEYPIAVLPSFYDDRIVVQKSGFILFGKNKKSIDEIQGKDDFFDLAKIKIDTNSVKQILSDVKISGVDYHTLFPDIEGLVLETKKIWNLK